MAPTLVVFWRSEGPSSRQNKQQKYFPWGFPKVEITGGTPRNITHKLEKAEGGFRGQYMDKCSTTFSKCWLTHVFMVLSTFIKVDPFGSSTENDATGGAHLFGPTTDLLWSKIAFFKEIAQHPKIGQPPIPSLYIPMMWGGPWGPLH